jgi:hypothetical protein
VEAVDEDMILDLTTLAPKRSKVRLPTPESEEGELFDLRSMDDFGIAEQQQLTMEGKEFDALWNTQDLNSAQRKRLKTLLDHMLEKVLDAPAPVKKHLKDGQRSQIVLAFTLAPLSQTVARERSQEMARETGSTTAS